MKIMFLYTKMYTTEMFVLKIVTHRIRYNDLTSPFASCPHVTSHDSPKWKACSQANITSES